MNNSGSYECIMIGWTDGETALSSDQLVGIEHEWRDDWRTVAVPYGSSLSEQRLPLHDRLAGESPIDDLWLTAPELELDGDGPWRPQIKAQADAGPVTGESPIESKVAFFERMFAARRDVYAQFWENPRYGTKGWRPAVQDELKKGTLWQRRPLPLTADVIAAHLDPDSDTFIGLYPLLADGTCWWLAANFDGPQAMLDAHAYMRAAASLDVPCALEISQSGRGAHVWTFFDAPVKAADAHALGTACVYRAMALRSALPLSLYDSLYPGQDTAVAENFGAGCLIAAPLNGERQRDRGSTAFVDWVSWEPFPDQWAYLSSLPKMTPEQVFEAGHADEILVGGDVTRLKPSPATSVHPKAPAQVRAVLGAQLTINDEDLTPELSAALRHAAVLTNPQFDDAQRSGRSTVNIPRFVQGYDVAPNGDLILPRGLRRQAANLVTQAGSELVFDDRRQQGDEIHAPFVGTLERRQMIAVDEMLAHGDGILQVPAGAGKTAIACAIIAERGVSTLILINKTAFCAQWRDQIRIMLGAKTGQLGGGRVKLSGQIDIIFLQSLAQMSPDEIRQVTSGYGQVIVDECYHVGTGSYDKVVSLINAAWWLGITAAPDRKDGLEQMAHWQLGPVRHVLREPPIADPSLASADDDPRRVLRVHQTSLHLPESLDLGTPHAMDQLNGIVANHDGRNYQIADDIRAAMNQGRKCLVLARRRDHLTTLAGLLPDAGAMIIRGGTSTKTLAAIRAKLADSSPSDPLLVMSTVPFGGEGFDSPIIDTVFLVAPISYAGLLKQAVGKALRRHHGKFDVVVHDYVDGEIPQLKAQYGKRLAGYQQMGFAI